MKQALIKQLKLMTFSCAILFAVFFSTSTVRAASYGLSIFDYNVDGGYVIGTHETYLDYNSSAYYAASVDGYLLTYNNDNNLQNYQVLDYRYQDHAYDAVVQTFAYVQRGKIYATYSKHYVIARYTYYQYYQDPYGYSRGFAETRQPTYNFTYSSPAYTTYTYIPVAATGVFVWLPNIQSLTVTSGETGTTQEVQIVGQYIGEHSNVPPDVVVSGEGVTASVNRIVPGEGVVVNVQIAANAPAGERRLSLKSGTAPYKVPSNSVAFTVTNNPPQLTSIDNPGAASGQTILNGLRGSHLFGQSQSVQVSGNGVTARLLGTQPNNIELVEIELQIAENADVGDYDITLTVNGKTSNPVKFRVGDRTPVITSVSPGAVDAGTTVSVNIDGRDFGANPRLEVEGSDVNVVVNSKGDTNINATLTTAPNSQGFRSVRVVSNGRLGSGFTSPTPGASAVSNPYPVGIIAKKPKIEIAEIGSIEKGATRPVNLVVKDSLGNPFTAALTIGTDSGEKGEAVFASNNSTQLQLQITGDGTKQVEIVGLTASNKKNTLKLTANYDSKTESRQFTVSTVVFEQESACSGFDNTEFERTKLSYLFVPQIGNNKVKAKIAPGGASGDFNLASSNKDLTVAGGRITSDSSQTVTITSTAAVTKGNYYMDAIANVSGAATASTLVVYVRPRIRKKVVIHAVTEGNRNIEPPSNIPDPIALEEYLNATTWGRQANIYFAVSRGADFTANFDLDRDGRLEYPSQTSFAEVQAIAAKLKVPGAFDLYYVGMDLDTNPYIAVALGGADVAFFGQNGLTNNTAAHEVGHLLGRGGHTPTDDPYRDFLMYDTLSVTPNTQCRIGKLDWDLVQPL